jgi:hypothetical protein
MAYLKPRSTVGAHVASLVEHGSGHTTSGRPLVLIGKPFRRKWFQSSSQVSPIWTVTTSTTNYMWQPRMSSKWRFFGGSRALATKSSLFIVHQACQLAWMDTIYDGMARLIYLKSTYAQRSDKSQNNVNKEFVEV